jgi:hypothetical protein
MGDVEALEVSDRARQTERLTDAASQVLGLRTGRPKSKIEGGSCVVESELDTSLF